MQVSIYVQSSVFNTTILLKTDYEKINDEQQFHKLGLICNIFKMSIIAYFINI